MTNIRSTGISSPILCRYGCPARILCLEVISKVCELGLCFCPVLVPCPLELKPISGQCARSHNNAVHSDNEQKLHKQSGSAFVVVSPERCRQQLRPVVKLSTWVMSIQMLHLFFKLQL